MRVSQSNSLSEMVQAPASRAAGFETWYPRYYLPETPFFLLNSLNIAGTRWSPQGNERLSSQLT